MPASSPSPVPSETHTTCRVGHAIDQLRRRTSYGNRLSRLSRLPYYLRPLPPQLQAEWDALKKFKTAPVNRQRDGLARKGKWREADDRQPGAAQYTLAFLQSFFGFLALPVEASAETQRLIAELGFSDTAENETDHIDWALRCVQGKGFDPTSFSMALLTDAELVLDHMDFMRHRTGAYSGAAMAGLGMVTALLREGTGYLRQQPDFGRRLPEPISDPDAWEAWCAQNLRKLSQAGRDLVEDDQVVLNREPSEPIAGILARESPIEALFELAHKIRSGFPKDAQPHTLAMHYRNYLFSRMLAFYPLRIKHYSNMKLGENIYLTQDGSWRIYFPASAFKNERGASKKDYDVPVDPSLWPILNEYIAEHRPHLAGGERTDGYLFLKVRENSGRPAGRNGQINRRAFRQILHRLTGTHLGVIFGPHAVRHIVATTILKQRPNDWQTAADALHDTQATVRKRYAHLAVAHGVANVNRFISELQTQHAA